MDRRQVYRFYLQFYICRLSSREIYEVYSSLRERLLLKNITGEAVVVHLDTDSKDFSLYLPVIFAVVATNNAFYFVQNKQKIHQVKKGFIIYFNDRRHSRRRRLLAVEL